MAPTFKKAKDLAYNPSLASRTLGSPSRSTSHQEAAAASTTVEAEAADDREALLIALGLADDVPLEQHAANEHKAPKLEATTSEKIGAFYPAEAYEDNAKVTSRTNAYDALRARLEATTVKLLHGRIDDADCDEVQELLLDQQHQIDLLLRGQSSLRGSMNSLRRSTMEKDTKTKLLHQQLEEQHGAALKEMEAKLEKAIEQVQQLQQTSRYRQRQQAASYQHSIQSASAEACRLRSRADDLQAALDSKEQELRLAKQHQEGLESQLEQERGQMEVQRANFTKQLQELADDCQRALTDAQAKATALAVAQAESQQLSRQLEEAAALQQSLTALSEQLQEQLKQAAAAAQQQQAESDMQKQELLAQAEQLQQDLQETVSAQERGCEQTQQLEQQRQELAQQLTRSRIEVQELQAQLAAVSKQQASASNESAGLHQELVAAVQAKTDLAVQLDNASIAIREMHVKYQKAEAALQSLQQQQVASADENASKLQEQQTLKQQVQQLKLQCKQSMEQVQKLESELAGTQERLQAAAKQEQENKAKLTTTESDNQQLQWKLAALQTELQKVQRTSSVTIQQLRQEADDARQQLSTVRQLADKQIAKVEAAAQQEVDLFRQRWRTEFEKRRKLHNQVIEMKGNIRVLARIRPMIEKERSASCSEGGSVQEAVRMADEETVLLEAANGPIREFSFDRVFGPSDGQLQVYEEVSGIVTSVMDGFSACIMAYGQTGSGKTYTIEGPAADPGINSRALAELFQVAQQRDTEVVYSLSASVLEIYQEQIFDLLTGSKDTGEKLDIKEGPTGLYIPNLRIESVGRPEDVAAVLQKGKQNRSTFATNMNEHSSRSHLVLSIYVTARQLAKDTTWSSKLHLIDLAGSERVSRSGAEGDRLKEAASINKSLSALGDVVSALQQRNSHVPYRNSKLTRLLEDSLGGSSKTLLVVNCSPASENVGETKCSLDFATRARKVELGAAVRVSELSCAGTCSSPNSTAGGRDSPGPGAASSPSRASQPSSGGGGPAGVGSATNSPRVSSRYTSGASELRQSVTRRAAATSHKEEK